MTLRAEDDMDKSLLDRIILRTESQPIGDGYIDIVVCPRNTYEFTSSIINAGFIIDGVSWWEYCKERISEAKYGMGGPKSLYYGGYLAEIPIYDIDHFDENCSLDFIESVLINKMITNINGTISYSQEKLWPGFWIQTPDSWKNDWNKIQKYSKIIKSVNKVINSWDPIGLISIGAPENEYDIEIKDFLPDLIDGKEGVIYESFKHYFGDAFRATAEDSNKIEKMVLQLLEKEC